LFDVPAEPKARQAVSWNWLAPVAIGAFSMLMIFGGHSQSAHSFAGADTNLFFASMTVTGSTARGTEDLRNFTLSKQDLNLAENVWHKAIFASTNLQQSPSSKRVSPAKQTNGLTL
jgi:hypothetical protein